MAVAEWGRAPLPAGWEFHPRPVPPRPGDAEAHELRLLEALRIAHALGAEFRIHWRTGRDGGWHAEPAPGPAHAAALRSVLAAYPGDRFGRRLRPPMEFPAGLLARPIHSEERPFRAGADAPWADAVGVTLAGLGPGAEVRWSVRSVGSAGAEPVAERPALLPVGPGLRTPVLSQPNRALLDREELRRYEAKWTVTAAALGPPDPVERLARVLEGASKLDGGNGLRFEPVGLFRRSPTPFRLSTRELAGLFPSPFGRWPDPGTEGPPSGGARLVLGVDPEGFPVSLPVSAGDGRHLVVTGETGMGKSTLLAELGGRAVARGTLVVFDPVGGTVESLLDALPPSALARTIWISPSRSPVGSNALAAVSGRIGLARERALDELVAALRRVRSTRYEASPFWGPRIEEVAHWAIAAAAALPGGTLRTAEELLDRPGRHVPAGLPEEAQQALAALRRRHEERPEEIEGARRLFAEVARSPTLLRLLSDPRARWSISEALRPGAITLLSGDAGAIGEPSALAFLAVQLALLWSFVPERRSREPVFLLLDEAGLYAAPVLAPMLRLSRRFGVHLVLATQSLATLTETDREAALTNASDFLLFRGSPAEAREFERWSAALRMEELVSLPRGRAIALLGKGQRITRIRTRPPGSGPRHPGRPLAVARQVRARWGPSAAPGDPVEASASSWPRLPSPLRRVIEALLECADPQGGGAAEIPLRRLRDEFGIPPEGLRVAGGWLAERGIARSVRGEAGTAWIVDPGRLREVRDGPGAAGASAASGAGTEG